MDFNFSDIKYITEDVHSNLLKRSQLQENDLLMTITGRIGTCAVVNKECLPGNINQHIVRIRLKPGYNPQFVAAFLNSDMGLLLSNRGVTGTTRIALDYESIKKIPIPNITNQSKQLYYITIIDAARKKKNRMIEQADEELQSHLLNIQDILNLKNPTRKKFYFAIKFSNLDGVIDAKRYVNLHNKLAERNVSDVCEVIDSKVNVSSYKDREVDWIRIDDLPNQPIDIAQVRTMPASEIDGTFFEVQENDILVARLGPTILNQKIVMVRHTERTTIASAEFLVLRCKEGYNPEAVMAILKTPYYRDLMYSHSRGSTPSRYRLNREDMLNLPFPDITDSQTQIANNAIEVRNKVISLRTEAEQDWKAAKEQFEKELLGETNE